ncbi:hypothetical protein M431DRAFT_385256 [Trichoderma harzianum CBS 226.95]|uniref:Uncharacterized protein n=1 Tax=Trichoderma harzianum CBS 226.95 TaxID=983964 RepID=A0A2T4AI50_TRIHA|nr:hypothetical protein M431DRAFT_385256 [Trichoderma harzianum CBS 226.95]PTB56712.1 hypothetical protein M431DRAFT_385256 [Trichoderma harzianum CBS 226.95]
MQGSATRLSLANCLSDRGLFSYQTERRPLRLGFLSYNPYFSRLFFLSWVVFSHSPKLNATFIFFLYFIPRVDLETRFSFHSSYHKCSASVL